MHIGLQIPSFKYPGGTAAIRPTLKDIAVAAEGAGFHSLWVMDHYYQIKGLFEEAYSDPMLESYTTLGYLAGLTEKVFLGVLVTGVIYRHPAVLLKMVNTLDIVSGGRAAEQPALRLDLPLLQRREYAQQRRRLGRLPDTDRGGGGDDRALAADLPTPGPGPLDGRALLPGFRLPAGEVGPRSFFTGKRLAVPVCPVHSGRPRLPERYLAEHPLYPTMKATSGKVTDKNASQAVG